MAQKKNQDVHDPEVAIEAALGKSEQFLQKNGKSMLIALAVITLAVGGYFAYKYLYVGPRDQKAADMMSVAQQQFAVDSFALALNGDGNNAGFLQVVDKYGATPVGNVANHYAGVCYLHMGDYDNAAKYLKAYKSTKGVPNKVVNAQNLGLQGDVLSQIGNYKDAAAKYEAAVKAGDNSFTSAIFLKKLGLVQMKLGENSAAIATFKRISEEYPSSMEARDIMKYIGEIEQK